MPTAPHSEKHFTATATVRDIVIGMSDGLTVPFALAAGLSGATSVTGLIVTAGLAEITAGAISMGLGGYLAGRTDVDHYHSERALEVAEVETMPAAERLEVENIFKEYGPSDGQIKSIVDVVASDKNRWVDFMMRFELGLEAPNPRRARNSALTIALAYIVGGFVPLFPYIVLKTVNAALPVSVILTLVALGVFGYFKARATGVSPLKGALPTILVGGIAAAVAFGIARAIG